MRRFCALAIALFLLNLFALPLVAAGPGVLEGKITNGSKGGEAVSGLEVTLHQSDGGSVRKAVSDSEGIFRFDSLTATDSISYTVSLSYSGVEYQSPAVAYGAGEYAKKIDLPVYETSDDIGAIEADIAHIILDIDPSQRVMVVTEFHSLSNSSNNVYVGRLSGESGQPELLRFPVPEGAVHPQSLDEVSDVTVAPLPDGSGLTDATPFRPGQRDVAYSYVLLYKDSSFLLQRPTAYKTGRVNILVSDVGAKVTAPGFSSQPPVDFGGNGYLVLSASGLAQGQDLQLQLSGLPLSAGAPQGDTDNLRLGGIILVPLAMAVALGLFFLRNRRTPMQTAPAEILPGADKERLVRSLAELDDRFDRGQITEPEYSRLRAETKRKLADLWRNPDGL